MLTRSSRALFPLLALLVWTVPLSAQRPPLHQGDTVRVYPKGDATPVHGNVVSVTADSLVLRLTSFAISDISRIEIARGRRTDRAKTWKWVVGGLVLGAVVGVVLGEPQGRCADCGNPAVSFGQLGGELGAGAGFLISLKRATDPAWYPIWPLPPSRTPVVAEAPRDTTPRQSIEPAYFSSISRGQQLKAWIGDTAVVEGRFAMLSQDSSMMELLNWPSVPLKSIDLLQVGHGHAPQGAVIGAVGLTLPMAFLAALGCAWGCDNNRVTTFLVGSAVIGGTIGGMIGASRVTWTTRFRR